MTNQWGIDTSIDCLCYECKYFTSNEDCKVNSNRSCMTYDEIYQEYFEEYVAKEMKNGVSREEAEEIVKDKNDDFFLDYCPHQKPPIDDYEPYGDYLIQRGEMEREEKAIEEMEEND